jgi:hypothetical protein
MFIVGEKVSLDGIWDIECVWVKDGDDFIRRASRDLIKESDILDCWFPQDSASKCTDALFIEAQELLVGGAKIEETRLGILIGEIMRLGGSLILWYGDDWADLPKASDSGQVLKKIEKQLLEGSGEVYLRYVGWARLAQASPGEFEPKNRFFSR